MVSWMDHFSGTFKIQIYCLLFPCLFNVDITNDTGFFLSISCFSKLQFCKETENIIEIMFLHVSTSHTDWGKEKTEASKKAGTHTGWIGCFGFHAPFRSISIYIKLSPRDKNDRRETKKKNKKTLNSPHWLLLQAKSIQVGCWVWKLPSGNMAKKSLIFRYSETTGIQ